MNDAGRLAMAILVLAAAFFLYFFAFHPSGVEDLANKDGLIDNPVDMLKWLMTQFNNAVGIPGNNAPAQSTDTSNSGTSTGSSDTGNLLPTPTGQPTTNEQLTGQ